MLPARFIVLTLEAQMRSLEAQHQRREEEAKRQADRARRIRIQFRWLQRQAARAARPPKGHDHPEWV